MNNPVNSTTSPFTPLIVVINVGSSTIKTSVFKFEVSKPVLLEKSTSKRDMTKFVEDFKQLIEGRRGKITAIAHRIVELDSSVSNSAVVSEHLIKKLIKTEHLAPLHNPLAISIIKICQTLFDEHVLQTIHSDSEFFKNLPKVASDYAISKSISSRLKIKKKGFHGFAHRSMLSALNTLVKTKSIKTINDNSLNRVITIQLGSGCSICAVKNNSPVDISMGCSTNEGLIMSNRSGDLDSLTTLKIQKELNLSATELSNKITQSSGLLGLTGHSGDMRLITNSDEVNDKEAIEKYCYRIRKYMGAYVAILGGVDSILIGGGVGYNNSFIREKIFANWQWLSILHDELNPIKLNSRISEISHLNSEVKIYRCQIDEEILIAEDAFELIKQHCTSFKEPT